MHADEFLPLTTKAIRHVRNMPRAAFTLASFLGLALLLACSFGCAPSSSQGDGKQGGSASASNDLPELTEEMIHERINDAGVREVPEENGTAEPISWRFDEEEPKEIHVVEKQMEGERATIVLDIKTSSASNARNPRYLAGQIRTMWELQTGWALRRWEIVRTENISMKYINLPKPPDKLLKKFDVRVKDNRTDELGHLGESINHLATRLSGFVHGQKRFLGDISHELYSPLARMRMQFALSILEDCSDEEIRRLYVEDVKGEVVLVSKLVSELLTYSKAGIKITESEGSYRDCR